MKCFAQPRSIAGFFFCVAVGASLIFGGFIGHFFSIFVNMMALAAFLNPSGFVVIIVSKDSRRPPLNLKTIPRHHHHILLGEPRQN
jgi:hypothetical protein